MRILRNFSMIAANWCLEQSLQDRKALFQMSPQSGFLQSVDSDSRMGSDLFHMRSLSRSVSPEFMDFARGGAMLPVASSPLRRRLQMLESREFPFITPTATPAGSAMHSPAGSRASSPPRLPQSWYGGGGDGDAEPGLPQTALRVHALAASEVRCCTCCFCLAVCVLTRALYSLLQRLRPRPRCVPGRARAVCAGAASLPHRASVLVPLLPAQWGVAVDAASGVTEQQGAGDAAG